jgi:hypothetical protein
MCYNEITKNKGDKKMNIVINYDELKNFFMTLIDNHIGCHECPYYDMCDGTEDLEECAELFIDQIAKKEL